MNLLWPVLQLMAELMCCQLEGTFYGVDPQTLPTKVAWEVGKARADGVIEAYIADEGKYPETIGMVMGSDMRTHGVSFAQFLYLLGIRPIWQKAVAVYLAWKL